MRNYASQAPTGKRLRRLKPRQRKKLHVGEYQQFVFELKAAYNTDASSDALLDDLIDMIESRKLYFGGGVGEGKIDGIVSTGLGSPTEEDRQAALQWLKNRPEITDAEVGEFADAWYGCN